MTDAQKPALEPPKAARYRCRTCHRIAERTSIPIACSACGDVGCFAILPADFKAPEAPPASVVHISHAHTIAQPARATMVAQRAGAIAPPGAYNPALAVRAKASPLFSENRSPGIPRLNILPCIDFVLGGSDEHESVLPGVACGTTFQIAGRKGAGKSTLLMQALGSVAQRGPVIYGTGEEGRPQIEERAHRLRVFDDGISKGNLLFLETDVIEDFLDEVRRVRPLLAIYDSEQVARSRVIDAEKRSSRMVYYVVDQCFQLAHQLRTTVIGLVCQLVKDGSDAGPEAAGHGHDALLRLEMSEYHPSLRELSCDGKNRNGPSDRIARLAMEHRGLVPWESKERSE